MCQHYFVLFCFRFIHVEWNKAFPLSYSIALVGLLYFYILLGLTGISAVPDFVPIKLVPGRDGMRQTRFTLQARERGRVARCSDGFHDAGNQGRAIVTGRRDPRWVPDDSGEGQGRPVGMGVGWDRGPVEPGCPEWRKGPRVWRDQRTRFPRTRPRGGEVCRGGHSDLSDYQRWGQSPDLVLESPAEQTVKQNSKDSTCPTSSHAPQTNTQKHL